VLSLSTSSLTVDPQERNQLEAIRDRQSAEKAEKEAEAASSASDSHPMDQDFEGGFGGQEDLEDRYATTSGEH